MVEEGFGKIKKSVDLSANNACTTERAMAVTIDSKLVSATNNYTEVDVHACKRQRTCLVDAHTFRPPVRQSTLSDGAKAVNLQHCAGYGDAAWYSPAHTKDLTLAPIRTKFTSSAPRSEFQPGKTVTNKQCNLLVDMLII